MTSCNSSFSEQSLVIETCKEIKLPGPCPQPSTSILCSVTTGTDTPAQSNTITLAPCPTTCSLVFGQMISGPGIAPGTFIEVVFPCVDNKRGGTQEISISTPTTEPIPAHTFLDITGSSSTPLAFSDFLSLFDATQCGAPRFALIEITNLGNCQVGLLSATSLANVPPPGTVALLSSTLQLADGVTGISLFVVQPGQSVVFTSCDLVSLFAFCFASTQGSLFTTNGCDFTFSIKAFFCVPGCSSSSGRGDGTSALASSSLKLN